MTAQALQTLRDLVPAAREESLPAAQTVAQVVALRSGRLVRLPAPWARAAVEAFLQDHQAEGDVVEGPCGAELAGRALREDEWAVRLVRFRWDPRLMPPEVRRVGERAVCIFPKHTVVLAAAQAGWLLRALERVKPDELDDEGRPLPWVPVRHETRALGAATGEDDDAVALGPGDEPPAFEPPPDGDPGVLSDGEIRGWFERLARHAGWDQVPLTLTRGRDNKLGFTTGRVWYRSDFVPRRVHLTTCPNSDLAEVLATIVHELAHPLSRTHDHGDAFKRAMLSLAEAQWGEAFFREARARLSQRSQVLDYWLATGIRAALLGAAPPAVRSGDDGQLARVVTKIRKLRELAANQLGRPEAVSATAVANDLVTTYELGDYAVRVDAGIQDQMVDRWVPVREGAVWRRELAHAVAKASGVFSLSVVQKSRMHFFGRYADVVQAEYLFQISAARIERECERHLKTWRIRHPNRQAGDARRERTSFCDSAVREFSRKLDQIVAEESGASEHDAALDTAEEFARVEHEKRGTGWRSGGTRRTHDNAAGRELGRSLEVVRGLSSSGEAPRRLASRH